MKKSILISISLLILIVLGACAAPAPEPTPTAPPADVECEEGSEICLTDAGIVPQPDVAAPVEQTAASQLIATGSGQVQLTPDMAYIYIGVNSQSEIMSEAMNSNNETTQAVIDTIKEMGVDEKDIQTSNFSVYPQTQYSQTGEEIKLYSIDNNVYITVYDLTKLNDIIEASINAGANSMSGMQFDVSDKTAALEEAQKLAIDDAKQQAQRLAEQAGIELGDLKEVSVSSSNAQTAQMYGGYGGGGGMMNVNKVPISAGQLGIFVEATLVYEID